MGQLEGMSASDPLLEFSSLPDEDGTTDKDSVILDGLYSNATDGLRDKD